MSNKPLSSEVFRGVGISARGVGFQIKNADSGINYITVNTSKPSISMTAPTNITNLTVNNIVLGNPPGLSVDALLHIYSNNANIDPQVLIEQGGTGDAGILFSVPAQGLNYTIGIDQSDNAFKIGASGVVSSQTIFKYFQNTLNVGIGLHTFNVPFVGTTENNVAFGSSALGAINTGEENVAVGSTAMQLIDVGQRNTAVGSASLAVNFSGNVLEDNVAVGRAAMNGSGGSRNVAVGVDALNSTNTNDNVAIGYNALLVDVGVIGTSGENTAIGYEALNALSGGTNNIVVGYQAGTSYVGTESDNIIIGNTGTLGDNNEVRLGTSGTHERVHLPGALYQTNALVTPAITGTFIIVSPSISQLIVTGAGPIASLGVNLGTPSDSGRIINMIIYPAVVALTIIGNASTVITSITSPTGFNTYATFYYNLSDDTWYQVGS